MLNGKHVTNGVTNGVTGKSRMDVRLEKAEKDRLRKRRQRTKQRNEKMMDCAQKFYQSLPSGFHYQLATDGSVRVEFLDSDAADGKLVYELSPQEWAQFQKELSIVGYACFPRQRKRSGNVYY